MPGSDFKTLYAWWRLQCLCQVKKLAIGSPGTRHLSLFELELRVGPLAGLRTIKKRVKILSKRQNAPGRRNSAKHHSLRSQRAWLPCLHVLHVAARAVAGFVP